jgi:hypothetical protein
MNLGMDRWRAKSTEPEIEGSKWNKLSSAGMLDLNKRTPKTRTKRAALTTESL